MQFAKLFLLPLVKKRLWQPGEVFLRGSRTWLHHM